MSDEIKSDPLESLRHQTTLARFGEFALRSEDLDEILTEACRLVGDALGTDLAKVMELQKDGETLLVRAGVGWKPGVVGSVTIRVTDTTSEGHALKTGQPMISPDINAEKRFRYPPFLTENGVKAVANVIIIGAAGQPPFGILQVDSRTPRQFMPGDIAFLRSYANLLAAAVERLGVILTLRKEDARLARALNVSQLGAWDLDLVTGAATATPRYNEILGITDAPAAWRYADFLDRVVAEDRVQVSDAFSHSLNAGTDWHVRCRIRRAGDGALRWIEARGRPDGDHENPRARLLGLLADITEPKEAEEELRRARDTLEGLVAERTNALTEANVKLRVESTEREQLEQTLHQLQKIEAVSQLSGGLAHDFNNLLQAISGSLDLMHRRIAEGHLAGLDRYVAIARSATDRGASLIHSLLAFSRRQTLDPKTVDLNDLVSGISALCRSTVGPGVHFKTNLEAGISHTLCDPNQLESALLNLVVNARDAMPDGGSLTIETANDTLPDRRTPEADAALKALQPGTYVTVSVTDTGTGMPASVISRAIEPFFTTKPIGQGTGLGLSMIYGFVQQSNGHLQIRSKEGVGTCVTIFLPRHAGEVTREPAMVRAIVPSAAKETAAVLLVEDDGSVRTIIAEVLSDQGYTVLEAGDGRAGLDILQAGAAVDLLVTDVGLPGGMDGRQLADLARLQRPKLKVLFITGYAASAAVGNGDMAADMEVITKPFRVDELLAGVQRMTSRSIGVPREP